MELSKLEIELLLDIYEMDINLGERINENSYELIEQDPKERRQEFIHYLLKLKRFGRIDFDESKTFVCGGIRSEKYRTNVVMIWPENIHILEKGIQEVEEAKKTVMDKVKETAKQGVKEIGSKVYDEVKDWTSKTISEYFVKITKG